MVDLYLLAGVIGIAVYAVDRMRILGWLFGLAEQRTVQMAYATGSAAAVVRRVVTRGAPTVWEVTRGCRIVCAAGPGGFGSHSAPVGEMTVTGSRWVHQRVAGKSTADWREFSLDRGGETSLLVALKFMNKLMLMRRLRPDEFAEGCSTVEDVERFILRHNRAGTAFVGGPEHEALRVGRVGPVQYSDVEGWPTAAGVKDGRSESFLAGSEDRTRQLLARKEGGLLFLWYGQALEPSRLEVRPAVTAG